MSKENVQSTIDLISGTARTNFLSGVARTDLGLTILLSLDTVLSEYDIKEVEKLARIREQLSIAGEVSDEVVVSGIVDLAKDDLSEADKFDATSIGEAPLDLNQLTKPELLKIAIEMEIDDVTTRTNKDKLIQKIKEKMGE